MVQLEEREWRLGMSLLEVARFGLAVRMPEHLPQEMYNATRDKNHK